MNVQKVNYRNPNAASDFTKSLKHTGFSVITNHPIEKSLIDSIYEEWGNFFKNDKKFDYLFNKKNQDGYFPLGTENAKGTLRKETGKIRKARKEVARLLTRLNEVKKE